MIHSILPSLLLTLAWQAIGCLHSHPRDEEAQAWSLLRLQSSNHSLKDFDPNPYMKLALAAAERAPGAPFGAIIVNISNPVSPTVLATGGNNATYNPSWHAEIVAINEASNVLADQHIQVCI
jgi:hypothetical protein